MQEGTPPYPPVSTLKTQAVLSADADAMRLPVLLKHTSRISSACELNVVMQEALAALQSLTVASMEPVTMTSPLKLKEAPLSSPL